MEYQDGTIIRAQLRGQFFFITRHACAQTTGLRGQTPPDCRTHMRYLVTKKGNRFDPSDLLLWIELTEMFQLRGKTLLQS
jgi:hypothetical protein